MNEKGPITAQQLDALIMNATVQLNSAVYEYKQALDAVHRESQQAKYDVTRRTENAGDLSLMVTYALTASRVGVTIRPFREALANLLRIREYVPGDGFPGVVQTAMTALSNEDV